MDFFKKSTAALSVIIFTLLYYLWIILQHNSTHLVIVSDLLQTIPPTAVLILIFKTCKNSPKNNKYFWFLIGIGCGSYLFSQLAWDFYEIILGIRNPVFGWTVITWGISTFSYIFSISFKIHEKSNDKWTLLLLLDSLIVMCIAISVTWVYIFLPSLNNIIASDIPLKLYYVAYPVGNLICLFFAVNLYMILRKNDPERMTLYLISLAFFVMFLANFLYSYQALKNTYLSGSLIDPLWSLYILILGLASIEYNSLPVKQNQVKLNNYNNTYPSRSTNFLPLISIIALYGLMLYKQNKVVWFFAGVSIILITMRHGFIILQNRQLISRLEQVNEALEDKVNERTKELYNLAFYDQLTGLSNRRRFEERLKTSLKSSMENENLGALMFLDLDRFKIINDTLGHSFGDMLLKEIAKRLKGCLNSFCTISRQGGDEFAILMENVKDQNQVSDMAENILSQLISPISLNNHKTYISCSIGIVLFPLHGKDPETLMKYADAAMYKSKELGKNTYQFYNYAINAEMSKRLNIERGLRKAIENNEFVLYYQPQVNVLTGNITGVEALIRWIHPLHGMILPSYFIPIAEETGLIDIIGKWVLKTACRQVKKWHNDGFLSLKIGVNISPIQIHQEDFIFTVDSILRETKLSAEFLDLEVTEGIAIENSSIIIKKLKKLKELGVKISIDDFGTGYSSLSYLDKLPVDTLKIAQEFVRFLQDDIKNKAIISAIIAIAENLGIAVIAEGAENIDQLEFLKSQNCFNVQGYFFSKPISADLMEDFLIKNKLNPKIS